MNEDIFKQIGSELRAARLASDLSLNDLASKLKIHTNYIKAIEEGSISLLKLNAYSINYIKRYAEFFNLNYQTYLQQIKAEQTAKLPSIASINLITGKEFLPSKKVLFICTILLITIYFI